MSRGETGTLSLRLSTCADYQQNIRGTRVAATCRCINPSGSDLRVGNRPHWPSVYPMKIKCLTNLEQPTLHYYVTAFLHKYLRASTNGEIKKQVPVDINPAEKLTCSCGCCYPSCTDDSTMQVYTLWSATDTEIS